MCLYSYWLSTPPVRSSKWRAEMKYSMLRKNWQDKSSDRYFQEPILWAKFLYLLISRKGRRLHKNRRKFHESSGNLIENMCLIACILFSPRVSLVSQTVKNPPAVWETWVQSLGWEDPLEEGMATHSSILAYRIPMDREAQWDTVHEVTESDTTEWLSSSTFSPKIAHLLEKEMATHSCTVAQKIPCMEEFRKRQPTGSQSVRQVWVTPLSLSLTFLLASLVQFLRATEGAVSWPAVLTFPQIKQLEALTLCVFFFFFKLKSYMQNGNNDGIYLTNYKVYLFSKATVTKDIKMNSLNRSLLPYSSGD